MDKTTEYSVKCRKAAAIQTIFKNFRICDEFGSGHFVSWRYRDDEINHVTVLGEDIEYDVVADCLFYPGAGRGSHTPEKYKVVGEQDWTWLPRLDQLLEMLSGGFMTKISKLYHFSSGTHEFSGIYDLPSEVFPSTEQLALGLVLFENHRLVWKNDGWIRFIK